MRSHLAITYSISIIKLKFHCNTTMVDPMECCKFNWTFRPIGLQTNHISIVFHIEHLMCSLAFCSFPFGMKDGISISFWNLDTFHPNELRTDVNNSLIFHRTRFFFCLAFYGNRFKRRINGALWFLLGKFFFRKWRVVWLHCLFFWCAKTLWYATRFMNEMILTNCKSVTTILHYFCIKYLCAKILMLKQTSH